MQPTLPIDVDEQTGVWRTDGLPMLYVPRHFFMNNHLAAEGVLGREAYAALLYPAGHKSAYYWCEQESRRHKISGAPVYEHYLRRLSQRGWGIFALDEIDPAPARASRCVTPPSCWPSPGRPACSATCTRAGSRAPWIG